MAKARKRLVKNLGTMLVKAIVSDPMQQAQPLE